MSLHHIIRIIKTLSIYATTKLTSEFMQNGTFLQLLIEKDHGTVKRLAAKASLQRPYNEQIITP